MNQILDSDDTEIGVITCSLKKHNFEQNVNIGLQKISSYSAHLRIYQSLALYI